MILNRLEMQNFLAYRGPEPIDFEGIALACLTGQNGVGKSSILDAITWALWGKARAKRDQDLIHLGQREARVSLDFELEGIRYRVARRRALAGRGSRTRLDLLVWGDDGSPNLINEGGQRGTQEKINDILRLDYETFAHSAFLQQGRADAFTTKTPAERKRILADLLGLERWAEYEERAKQRLNDLRRQVDILEHDIGRIDREIAREPQLAAEMERVSADYSSAQAKLERISAQYQDVANAAKSLGREREHLAALQRRISSAQDDIGAARTELERQDGKIAAYQGIIAQASDIEAGYRQLREARTNQSLIAEQLAQKQELDARYHQVEGELQALQSDLQRQRDVSRERIDNLEAQLVSDAGVELEAIQSELAALTALDQRRADALDAVQAAKQRRSGLLAQQDALRGEGTALNERIARLEAAQGATCPLCGQALTESHRGDMLAQLTAERDEKREDYRQYSEELQQIDEAGRAREAEVNEWAQQLKDLPGLQQRAGALAARKVQAEEAERALAIARRELEQVQDQLDGEDYGQEYRRQLAQLEDARARIGYDAESHADMRARLETLSDFDRQQKQLEFAQMNLPEARSQRDKTATQVEALRETMAADAAQLTATEERIAGMSAQAQAEPQLRSELDAARAEAAALQERRAIVRQELGAIESGRRNQERLKQRLSECERQRGLLGDLRAAFGKNGVPAMIIEATLPELEAEANDLLARMTDGRMTIGFNTQRQMVSGALAETLDIEIADELGARDYELYSGGEAFRINFAIRIALSKLLARRAGAHLRTLFIDEGFGSQDVDGRDKLVDAISAIQSDFDLILVISHLEELREAFPVQMLVEKTAEGSAVTIR